MVLHIFIFFPNLVEMIQFDKYVFVQMGWFNHQLGMDGYTDGWLDGWMDGMM